jgi:F0F1-type ATP synthase membrane subunit c/vacuolar-type H+-ATPase subunit K
MKLPLIVQFRRKVSTRRQSTLFDRHPGLIFLVAFAGPLLAMIGFSTYRCMQQYIAKGLPIVPLLLVMFATWTGIGLSRQLRLNRDRKWNNFIRYMPIRPIHLLTLRVYVGIPVGIVGIVLLTCGLRGAGTELWTIRATIKWLLIGATFVWMLSLQSFLAVVASRFAWGQRFLISALALWGIVLLGRFAWGLKSGDLYAGRITDICLTDAALVASGIISLVCTLIPQHTAFPVTGFWAVLHVALVSTILTALSWKLVRRPPLSMPARPKDLFLTVPFRKFISSILPDSCGGQICIELLRMFRGPHMRLLFYVTVSVIVALGLQIKYPDGNNHIFILVVFAVFAVNERADLLQIRQADFLYYMYGVDAKDYLRGLITSVGLLISVLCIVQVPIFRDCDIQMYSKIVCVCIAIAFSSIGMSVAFDHYSRNTKFFKYLTTFMLFLAVISEAWGMIPLVVILSFNVIRLPCLIYSLILFCLSFGVNWFLSFLPLLIAGAVFASEITRTGPDTVKKWYWRIAE